MDAWLHIVVAFIVSIFIVCVVVLPEHCSVEHLHCEHIIAFIFEVSEAAEIHTVRDGEILPALVEIHPALSVK